MENKESNSPKWDWLPCNYNLKTEIKKKIHVWNLQPGIVLTNPSDVGSDPIVKLYLDTEKQLQYSNQIGWNWHKSWNLPNISVRIDIKERDTGDPLLCPKNLYAQLFAVKAVIDQPDHFHLVDVGIRGQSKLEMINGQAFFTAIKFYSTSYNNEGVKFHLVLVIFIQNDEDEIPKVLNATISPPIFVDSRKSARDQQFILEKKMNSFVQPFPPDTLQKKFIKRENKRKSDVDITIHNDKEGLYNYLTAPNIRHKVKHPLFLCMKFSQTCKLYYNSNLIEDSQPLNILEILQKKLTKDHYVPISSQQAQNKKMDDKIFILYIQEDEDPYKNKKINESVEPLICQSLGIIYNLNFLPPLFSDLAGESEEILADLPQIYKSNYQNLQNIVNQIKNYDEEEYENGENEEDEDYLDMNNNGELEASEASGSDSYDAGKAAKKQKPNPKIENNILNQIQNSQQNNDFQEINLPIIQNKVIIKKQIDQTSTHVKEQTNNLNKSVKNSTNNIQARFQEQSQKQSFVKQEKQEQINNLQGNFGETNQMQSLLKNFQSNQQQNSNNMSQQSLQQLIGMMGGMGGMGGNNNFMSGGSNMNMGNSNDFELQIQMMFYQQQMQQQMNQNQLMGSMSKNNMMNMRNQMNNMGGMSMTNFNNLSQQMGGQQPQFTTRNQNLSNQNQNQNQYQNQNQNQNQSQSQGQNMFNMFSNPNMLQNMSSGMSNNQPNMALMYQLLQQQQQQNNPFNFMNQNSNFNPQQMLMSQLQNKNMFGGVGGMGGVQGVGNTGGLQSVSGMSGQGSNSIGNTTTTMGNTTPNLHNNNNISQSNQQNANQNQNHNQSQNQMNLNQMNNNPMQNMQNQMGNIGNMNNLDQMINFLQMQQQNIQMQGIQGRRDDENENESQISGSLLQKQI